MDIVSTKKKIIVDTVNYTIAQYSSNILGFVCVIAVSRFLGPYYMGVWNLLKIVMRYCNYSTLGTGAATAYKIPFLKGKKDEEAIGEIRDSFFSFSILVSVITSLVLFVATLFLKQKYSPEIITGIYVLCLFTILQRIYNVYIVLARAHKNFTVLCKVIWIDSIVNIIFVFLLVRNHKLYGLYAAIILTMVFNLLYLTRVTKYEVRFRFDWNRIFDLIKYGFPILITSVLGVILLTADRIMIAKMIGVTYVGYYGIGIMARNYVNALSSNFGTIIMPHMMESYGNTAKTDSMRKFVIVSTELIACLLPPVLGGIYIALPLLISVILPKFTPGILVVQILLLDMFFRSCNPQFKHFLVALGKQKELILITVFAIILNIILNYLLISRGWGICGVAISTSITSFFVFLILLIYAVSHFNEKINMLRFILKLTVPVCYTAFIIVVADSLVIVNNMYAKTVISLLILAVFSLPIYLYVNKRTKILNIVMGLMKEKMGRKKYSLLHDEDVS